MTQVSRGKALAELATWKAGKMDKGNWGEEKQQINVQVSVQSLHLDALRRRALTDAERRQEIPEADYEVLPAAPEAASEDRSTREASVSEPASLPKPNDLNDLLS